MMRPVYVLLTLAAVLLSSCRSSVKPDVVALVAEADSYNWPDPARYEKAVAAFETEDAASPPPKNAIVGIGSSSMRGWHKSIHEDLAPLTVIPRGFGGSDMYDVLAFVDRIVIPYEPRAVMLYEGDNDIAAGLPPEAVLAAFRAFAAKIHQALPQTRIYVLSVKPSISRWSMWPQMVETNELLKAECATDDRLHYIDIATPMLGEDGEPLPDIFLKDNLHMNRKGYDIWTETVRPVLMEHEVKHEGTMMAGAGGG